MTFDEKSAVNAVEVPTYLMSSPLLLFSRFYLLLWLSTVWIYDVSRWESPWVYPMWSFWTSWIYRWMFSIKCVKFSAIISSVTFYLPFSHSPFLYNFHYGCIGKSFGVPLVCEALFIFLHLFFFLFPRLDIDAPIFKFPDSFLPVRMCCLAPQLISFILFLYF